MEFDISALVGKTIKSVAGAVGDDRITFECTDATSYCLYHSPDCCESVTVEDICGDMADLIGTPVVMAEESFSRENPIGVTKEDQVSFTWTFYRIQTVKGLVVIRWYGDSNGYYSERVEFEQVA